MACCAEQRVQVFIFVKTRDDRLQQHEVGVDLLTQLHDYVKEITGPEDCWYQGKMLQPGQHALCRCVVACGEPIVAMHADEPGLHGGNYAMTVRTWRHCSASNALEWLHSVGGVK